MVKSSSPSFKSTVGKLVDGKVLLEQLFDEGSRPTDRWLRMQQKRRVIPFLRIGRLIRFDVEAVRAALTRRFSVRPRAARSIAGSEAQ